MDHGSPSSARPEARLHAHTDAAGIVHLERLDVDHLAGLVPDTIVEQIADFEASAAAAAAILMALYDRQQRLWVAIDVVVDADYVARTTPGVEAEDVTLAVSEAVGLEAAWRPVQDAAGRVTVGSKTWPSSAPASVASRQFRARHGDAAAFLAAALGGDRHAACDAR